MKKTVTIRKRILRSIVSIVSVSLVILGSSSIYLNYSSTNSTIRQTMTEAAKLAADRIHWELTSYLNIIKEIGTLPTLYSSHYSLTQKQEIIDKKSLDYGMQRGNILDKNGLSIFDGTDFSDRDYYQAAMRGETYISEPLVSKITGNLTFIIAAPIWKNGVENSEPIGVVYMVPNETFLNDIVTSIQVSKNSGAYIIDSTGTTVAHYNSEMVYNKNNSIENAKSDSSLNAIAKLEKNMIEGKSDYGTYTYKGIRKLLAYTPIEGTNGWSIGINAPLSDFFSETLIGIIIVGVILIISILVSTIFARKLAHHIAIPVEKCAKRLELLSTGDLTTDVVIFETGDETEILSKATNSIVTSMRTMIGDIKELLVAMADGNFDIKSKHPQSYVGDFEQLLSSIQKINSDLSSTLKLIKESTKQVSTGADQLSESSISLAEGATEQAGAVEELMAAINNITDAFYKNAKEANDTSANARRIGKSAKESTAQMNLMINAMQQINNASKQIANIIMSIEEIASQTSLLSLNASIEAARAGEAGRGFAVVAGEIGHLSNQSADAVNETRKMIEKALNEVENGNSIMNETAKALTEVITGIEDVIQSIESVANSCIQQSESMQEINQGIDQISSVVQANSSLAEESSATSEELSAQATTLDDMTEHFILKDEKTATTSTNTDITIVSK